MKNKMSKKGLAVILAAILCAAIGLMGCASADSGLTLAPGSAGDTTAQTAQTATEQTAASQTSTAQADASEYFTERDLEQEPDLSEAIRYTLTDGQTLTLSGEGVYVLSGTAKNAAVIVEAGEEDKVQLVLDGLNVTNDDFPCIYVKSADKVFVTTIADSNLTVTGSFRADGETNTDAVIFSKDDLVLNGSAKLSIRSSEHGVVCKDDLKITGGSYDITAEEKGLKANDSIRIAGGTLEIKSGDDAVHAENDEDDSLGWVYVSGGSLSIDSGDDGVHGTVWVQIDGGSLSISAGEGIEGTTVRINGGEIAIQSWDDGINAARKSTAYPVLVEINGGTVTIAMGAGDTDGIDSNGDIVINGGTISITGSSGFDYDGTAQLNGGTVIVNGQTLDTIPNQFMGGMGGMGGGPGGMGQGGEPGSGGFGGGPGMGGGPGGGRP